MLPAYYKKKMILISKQLLKIRLFFQVALLSSINLNQETIYQEY